MKVSDSSGRGEVAVIVNGDPRYSARTTLRAISLLFSRYKVEFDRIEVRQSVDVPIGAGFGASAASALSAVYASAAALGIHASKAALALCAHEAELLEQTGLGTVSVTYKGVGAGAIFAPGTPGKAKFLNVDVPPNTRLVTACLAPFDKREAFSSAETSRRIVELGDAALRRFLVRPTLEGLAREGERFSSGLGLETQDIRLLREAAKTAGASHASQNMIGHAVHTLTTQDSAPGVVEALKGTGLDPRIDVFEVGSVSAGPA